MNFKPPARKNGTSSSTGLLRNAPAIAGEIAAPIDRAIPVISAAAERSSGAALVNDPKLVLADEPTGNLDEENAREVVRLLTQSCKERQATLIVATHDIRTFEGANRVFTLRSGLLREELVSSNTENRQTC